MSDKAKLPRAEISISFNNVDITGDINKDLKSFSFTDEADGATDNIQIELNDRNNVWMKDWLVKETENRGMANQEISEGGDGDGDGEAKSYTVTAKIGLNVRSGKGTGYSRIGGLYFGSTIEVTEISDGWATIQYGGKTAYVSAQYLKETSGGKTETPAGTDGDRQNTAKFTKIGAVIISRNYDGTGHDRVLDCGTFELDDVAVKGPPQVVSMSATSLTYESAIRKTKKSRSWNQTTLKSIASQIAGEGGYRLVYAGEYVPSYTQMFQDNEDDISFLKRLAVNAGLAAKVTDGAIVLFDRKENEEREAVREIRWGDGTYSKFSLDSALSTTAYSSCHVSYEDDDGNTYEATFTPETSFSEGEVLEVKEEVSSNEEAMTLAQKRLRIANKGEMTGSFTVPGDTRLQAGNNITLKDFGDFDGKWSIEKATHKVAGDGYTTSIDICKVIEGY